MKQQKVDQCIEHASLRLNNTKKQSNNDSLEENMFLQILTCIALHVPIQQLKIGTIKNTRERLMKNILNQKSEGWTWNYWPRNSASARAHPYPDDIDDTACAITAIALWRPKLLNGTVLAHISKSLIMQEEKPGGPYYTWIGQTAQALESKRDIDIAVNANIAYMLTHLGVSLPELNTYIAECIVTQNFASKYYHEPIVTLYFISRAYSGKNDVSEELIKHILSLQKSPSDWGNAVYTSLALSSLIRLQSKESGVIKNTLTKLCCKKASLEAGGKQNIFIEKITGSNIQYAGSELFSLAVYIEALSLYKSYVEKTQITQDMSQQEVSQKHVQRDIVRLIQKYMHESKLPTHMYKSAMAHLQKLRASSAWDEITLLPYSFSTKENKKGRYVTLAVKAGALGVLGWMAHTLDDDIMDEKRKSDTQQLSLSRYVHRMTLRLINICAGKDMQAYSEKILTLTDCAQFEDTNGAKINPNISANKSMAHALPSILAIMSNRPAIETKSLNSKTMSSFGIKIENAFRHYIYARQLSDDAHDWQEDITAGRKTLVTDLVQRKASAKAQSTETTGAADLQNIFWNECAEIIANKIIRSSRQSLQTMLQCQKRDTSLNIAFFNECVSKYLSIGKKMREDIAHFREFIKVMKK